MRIKYFENTDTALLEFSQDAPVEMQELIFQRIPEELVPA